MAVLLHRLAMPERTEVADDRLVLFTHRKTGARSIRELIKLFFQPAHRIFGEDGGGTQLRGQVADDQLIVTDPDTLGAQVLSQRQGAPQDHGFIRVHAIGIGIGLGALGADRRFDQGDQRLLVVADPIAQGR